MPTYSPDASLDMILAGIQAGAQSALQGLLQRQQLEMEKERLNAYKKQIDAMMKAQEINEKKLQLETALGSLQAAKELAQTTMMPQPIPQQAANVLGVKSTYKVIQPVKEKVTEIKPPETVPITKGQLPEPTLTTQIKLTPKQKQLLVKYYNLQVPPVNVAKLATQIVSGGTYKKMIKEGIISPDTKPTDFTPEQLEKWFELSGAKKGSMYNAFRTYLMNKQKLKEQLGDLPNMVEYDPKTKKFIPKEGIETPFQAPTIQKAVSKPEAVETERTVMKEVEKPIMIMPQLESGKPPLLIDNELMSSLTQQFPYVDPKIITDSAKYYSADEYSDYLRDMNTLNKINEKLANTGTLNQNDLLQIVSRASTIARSVSGLDSPAAQFTEATQKKYKSVFDSFIKEKIAWLKQIGAPKQYIDFLKGFTFDKAIDYKKKAFLDLIRKERELGSQFDRMTPEEQEVFELEYLRKNYGLDYKDVEDLKSDVMMVNNATKSIFSK